jgi:hypothetical protein
MTIKSWSDFARDLALYARFKLTTQNRGALLIRRTSDGAVVAGVFGNDNYLCDGKSRREVDALRRHLQPSDVHELGFGLSPDGRSWALIVKAQERFETAVGKAFQVELLKIYLEDAVWGAWREVGGEIPVEAGRYSLSELSSPVEG